MSADLQNSPVPLAEISQGPNAFEAFLDRNQKNLILLSIVLALAAAAWVVYQGIQRSNEETAGSELTKATALAGFQSVIDQHPQTAAGQSAMVLLADKQWAEGQQEPALATLRKFIAENPAHAAVPSAQASLGAKLMAQGKTAEAASIFESLANQSSARFIAPYALICLGDLAKAGGDLEKAEASYKKIGASFADSPFSQTATERLANLRAKPPVEIEPPPAPPTPPADAATPADSPSLTPIPGAPAVEFPAQALPPGETPPTAPQP